MIGDADARRPVVDQTVGLPELDRGHGPDAVDGRQPASDVGLEGARRDDLQAPTGLALDDVGEGAGHGGAGARHGHQHRQHDHDEGEGVRAAAALLHQVQDRDRARAAGKVGDRAADDPSHGLQRERDEQHRREQDEDGRETSHGNARPAEPDRDPQDEQAHPGTPLAAGFDAGGALPHRVDGAEGGGPATRQPGRRDADRDPDHHADQGRPGREAERLQVEVEERLDHAQAHARDQPPDDEAHEARDQPEHRGLRQHDATHLGWLRPERAQDAVGRRPLGDGDGEGQEHEEPADEHGDHRHQGRARR